MTNASFHDQLRTLYHPPQGVFTFIDVPAATYMVIDGQGDPQTNGLNAAMKWLYSIAHFLVPEAKERMGKKFAYPPLECLFWAEDEQDFIAGNKDKWLWRVMIVAADWLTQDMFDAAVAKVVDKRGEPAPDSLALDRLHEGESVQTMVVGDYAGIAACCRELYEVFLPNHGKMPHGRYHEIYLNDPNRTAPPKRKTVIRQPVTACLDAD